ncbi:MAG: sulfur transferase domain-containing protein [Acidobacteriota bacterium]|nr:sulfur transferase domain-containing protein [Acidobacteriota bacterium]
MRSLSLAAALSTVALVLAPPAAAAEQKDHGLRGAKHPEPGVLFGGQPSEDQLKAMAADGLSFVLDLRAEGENRGFDEQAALQSLDVPYLNVPVDAERLEQPETFERFIEAMDKADGPVLVHCASGNRVGALYYAYLVAGKGVDREEARTRAKENGLRSAALEKAVDGYLDSRP